MAEHKVPQDVEAEDKFLGPLSFKQFLFFGGALITAFLMYQTVAVDAAFLSVFILPFFAISVIMAFPWSKDQPTELWLASRIRFLLVQRKRIWDQDGVKELVAITVPKREAHIYSDGLSQHQVRGRLGALADVVDSRGWAVKNLQGAVGMPQTDRLVAAAPIQATAVQVHDEPDPLDGSSSSVAQQFDTMIQQSEEKRRQDTRSIVDQALHKPSGNSYGTANNGTTSPSTNPWFLQQDQQSDGGMSKFKTDFNKSLDEQKFLDKVHKKQEQDADLLKNSRMKVITPDGQKPSTAQQSVATTTDDPSLGDPTQNANGYSAASADPAIISLSRNDDLNIETIARQANKDNELGDDEVVISLHDH